MFIFPSLPPYPLRLVRIDLLLNPSFNFTQGLLFVYTSDLTLKYTIWLISFVDFDCSDRVDRHPTGVVPNISQSINDILIKPLKFNDCNIVQG